MAKGLGQSVRAFRKELRDMKSELDFDGRTDTPPPSPPSQAAAPTGAPTPEPPTAKPPREGGDAST